MDQPTRLGRPPLPSEDPPALNDDHWSSNPLSVKILQLFAKFGVYVLPIETGVKSKKRWESEPEYVKELYKKNKMYLDV